MGCWNETCGISRRAIRAGEPVRFLPIVQNPWRFRVATGWKAGVPPAYLEGGAGCYHNDFWTLFCYPIRGKYNDYGSIEDIPDQTGQDKAELKQFVELFKRYTIPLDLGDNRYHDPATTDLDLGKILNAIQEGRILFRTNPLRTYVYGDKPAHIPDSIEAPPLAVGYLIIKESVWQSLLKVNLNADGELWGDKPTLKGIKKQYAQSLGMPQKFDSLLFRSPSFDNGPYRSPLSQEVFKEDQKHLIQAAAELDMVSMALGLLRITLHPTTGAGSQSENRKLWKKVNEAWSKLK